MAVSVALVLLLVSALGATAASGPNGVQWKPRVEYEYELNARSLAGLPALQGQYSGVQYGGRVRVQGLTSDTAIIRLEKMSWSAMHARMQSGWWSVNPPSNETLPGHHDGKELHMSGAAAVARFQDGQVQTVMVSRSAKDWEVNLLQGVLAHLQLQTSAASAGNSVHGTRRGDQQTDAGVFRVFENGVSGRCEVQYEMAPINTPAEQSAAEAKLCAGKPYVQITKTKNFTNCEQVAEQARGLPKCNPAGNACGSLWTRTSVSQLIACGQDAELQLLQSISSGSTQAELQMREDSRANVFNSVNMTLTRAQPVRERIPTPKDGVMLHGLVYRVAGKQIDMKQDNKDNSGEDSDESVEVVNQRVSKHDDDTSAPYKKSRKNNNNNSDESNESDSNPHKKSSRKNNNRNDSSNEDNAPHKKSSRKNNNESSDESNESDSNPHKKSSRKNNNSNDSSDEGSAPHKKSSRKNNNNSSDESNESDSNPHKKSSRKNNNSNDSSDEGSAPHKKSSRKDNNNNSSNESNDSNSNPHKKSSHGKKSYKNNNSDSNDSSSESDSSPASHKQHKSSKNESNGYRNNNSNESNDSNSDSDDNNNHKKGKKLSRKNRTADKREDDGEDVLSDVFAGTLSPAQVQKNSSLAAALKQQLSHEVMQAAVELAQPQGPSTRTMERLSMAVRLARTLTGRQLRSVQDQLKGNSDQRELLRDVIAMCGSEACVQETVAMIKDRKMNAVAAQMALGSLPDRIAKPTRTILKQLQDLFKASDDQQVKIAAVLAMGNLAGRAPRPVAASAAAFLAEKLSEQKTNSPLRAPLSYALGSTATPQGIMTLIKVAKSSSMPAYQRVQAILALKCCALRSKAMVRDALLALYHGPQNPTAVRIAAVSLLAYSRPSLPLWQRLAISTHYEPNLAVSAYVWSTMDSFAKMQDPSFRLQSQYARLSMPLARRLPQGTHLAYNMVAASVDAQLDRISHEHAAFITSVDAANAYYRRVVRESGVPNVDQEVDVWAANPDDLVQAAMEAVLGRQDKDDKAQDRPASKDVPHSTRSIHDKLSIVRRALQDPQGHLRLTLRPFVNDLFLSFDKNTPNRIAQAVGKYMASVRSGQHFKAQQLGGEEMSISTVNDMGFPVLLRVHVPWVVRAQGSAQLYRNHSAEANVTMLAMAGLTAQLSVQPSWMSREYLAAVNGHALLQVPATTLRAQMNATDGRVSVSAEPQVESWSQHNGTAQLVRMSLQPLTASVELSQAELVSNSAAAHNATRHAAPQVADLSPCEDVSLTLRAPVKKAALVAWLRASRTVLDFPALGRPLTASRLELLAARPRALNASFSLVKAMMQSGNMEVYYPASLRQDNDSEQDDHQATTTTPAPATSSTTSTTTTTTVAPAVVRAPRASSGPHGRRGSRSNGTVYTDSGDIDFTASVFNATMINPYSNRINGSNDLYVLYQVLAGMDAAHGYVVGVNVTTNQVADQTSADQSRYSGFWTFGANVGGRLMRAGFFARHEKDNAQVAATGAVLRDIPAAANLGVSLHQAPALMLKAEYVQYDAKAVKKTITAAMETGRSAPKTHRLWQAAREQFCSQPKNATVAPSCRAILNAANTPDQYNLTINYNNQAEEAFGGAVHTALQAAKAYFWNQGKVSVDTLAGGIGNELGMGMTVQADGSLDGWLKTPRTLTEVVGAAAPAPGPLAWSRDTGAFCGLSTSRLHTLDGVQGDMQLGHCWHVLAKDCSGKSRVAVLARTHNTNSSALEIEVNIDNYQVAHVSPDGTWLNGFPVVNGSAQAGAAVEVRDAADVRVMKIIRAEDGAINIALPDHGMNLVYGNSSVVVKAGTSLRGRLCGMCGDFDGSSFGELVGPDNKALKSVQAVTDSYALKGPECGKGRQ